MFLNEIEREEYRADPAAALAQAKADIPGLEEIMKRAEVGLYNATSESQPAQSSVQFPHGESRQLESESDRGQAARARLRGHGQSGR